MSIVCSRQTQEDDLCGCSAVQKTEQGRIIVGMGPCGAG